MKMCVGSRRYWLTLLVLCLWVAAPASARITATVDRTEIALGETLRLILKADDGEHPDELDFAELEQDFRILQRSSATNARITGGQQSVSRTYELEIAPLRDGVLAIPAFNYSGRRTTPIAIKVDPTPKVTPGVDQIATFSAEISDTRVYVQAQTILTITLQQSVNLDNRAVSELNIPNTYIEPLEQKSFQRTINGQVWLVNELRYALFPQQSGSLTIPPISFSGRELLPGRSLLGARLGKSINLQTKPITLDVKAVPDNFPGDIWLPARRLILDESWSDSPDRLNVGDSTTRTLEIIAEGLQGSQLPPITSLDEGVSLKGLRFYPDKENIEHSEIPTGLEGYRLQSEALVVTEAGDWVLPERVIPWWNTATDTLEYARLPPVTVKVAGAVATTSPSTTGSPVTDTTEVAESSYLRLWQGLAAVGWLLALVMTGLWWGGGRPRVASDPSKPPKFGFDNRDLVGLRLACSQNDPVAARKALQHWGQRWLQCSQPPTLDAISARVDQPLQAEIQRLDRAAFSLGSPEPWRGDALFQAVRSQSQRESVPTHDALALYPDN